MANRGPCALGRRLVQTITVAPAPLDPSPGSSIRVRGQAWSDARGSVRAIWRARGRARRSHAREECIQAFERRGHVGPAEAEAEVVAGMAEHGARGEQNTLRRQQLNGE